MYREFPLRDRSIQNSYFYDTDSPGSKFDYAVSDVDSLLVTGSIQGQSNPNWRQQVALKQDATTPYTRNLWTGRPCILRGQAVYPEIGPGSHYHETIGMNFQSRIGNLGINTLPIHVNDEALKDQALTRLKRRLSNDIGDFSSMAPIAELHEMRGFIRNLAGLGMEAFKALALIKKTKGRSAASYASKVWLNFSFGAKPLMGAIQDASKAIDAYLMRTDHNVKVSGTASKRVNSSVSEIISGTYGASAKWSYDATEYLGYRYTGAFNLQLKSSNNYGIADHFGFDWAELPGVAWELIPFSWAFDYFANVSQYLGDTFELPNGSLLYLTLNQKYIFDCNISAKHLPNTGLGVFMREDTCVPGFLRCEYLDRTKLSGIPHRSLRLKTVDEVGKNAADKLLNLAAILVGSKGYRY